MGAGVGVGPQHPGDDGPGPLTLGEAARAFLPGAWITSLFTILLGAAAAVYRLGWFSLLWFAMGLGSAYVAVLAAALAWYGLLAANNTRRGTLCPSCRSRMWRVTCSACAREVPLFSLCLWGLIVPRCPHCSALTMGRRLKAYCHGCRRHTHGARDLYRKETQIIVWVDKKARQALKPEAGWEYTGNPGACIWYDRTDKRSAALLFIVPVPAESARTPPIDERLMPRVRLLLIASDISEQDANRINGLFGPRTLYERVDPI